MRGLLLISLIGVAALAGTAQASSFTVNPIRIDLDQTSRSGMLTVKNDSAEPLRVQVTAFAWSQSATGEVVLADSKDVIAFPGLVEIAPGAEKKIRVGVKAPASAIEQTYRVFVEELPGMQQPGGKTEVRVLTKFGVPVFVAPTKIVRSARVSGVAASGGKLAFSVENTGTVSTIVKTVTVIGRDARQVELFQRAQSGWYVLGGGKRDYQLELPADRCGEAAQLAIEVVTDQNQPIRAELALPAGACAR
ncbi:MAG TPA: fimbria/pilus periplasmic chaperone [Kofleriaceae bacterium]|nr:fimbria/pilus periplasmic chaperone [Kofleriaceae bacterium]